MNDQAKMLDLFASHDHITLFEKEKEKTRNRSNNMIAYPFHMQYWKELILKNNAGAYFKKNVALHLLMALKKFEEKGRQRMLISS